MTQDRETLSWRIGGPQGSGIDRVAGLFGRALAAAGLQVFARREYHSNIIGRHSYLDLRIGAEEVRCHHESPDIFVCFEPESLCRHIGAVAEGGFVLCPSDIERVQLQSLQFLDSRLARDLCASLERMALPCSTAGLMQQAERRGVHLLPIPFSDLLTELAEASGHPRRRAARAMNTLAVAASAAAMGIDGNDLRESIRHLFSGNSGVLALNDLAASIAHSHVQQSHGPVAARSWMQDRHATPETIFLTGSQSVALGKFAAGLGVQTYYPISPASDESMYLEAQLSARPATGDNATPVVLQVEDELAAITMACGAALTGARSATSTSGPGFCLMTEGLGWAGMNEVPVVVSHYQRGGPSTGMPTRTEQGDLLFALHAGHGEFPRLVLASGDIEECFFDAMQAFDYAERYQLPVIHLLDKALASSSQTLPRFEYHDLRIERGERFDTGEPPNDPIPRFTVTESGISPRPVLGQAGGEHWLSGAEHGIDGHVSEDPVVREQMVEKRARKLAEAVRTIPTDEKLKVYGNPSAAFTVLTWGSTKGAVLEAIEDMGRDGKDVRAIQLRLLWPFPSAELVALLESAEPLVVVECNHSGQMNALLAQQLGVSADHLVLKYSGRPMAGDAVLKALNTIHAGKGAARMVLRNALE